MLSLLATSVPGNFPSCRDRCDKTRNVTTTRPKNRCIVAIQCSSSFSRTCCFSFSLVLGASGLFILAGVLPPWAVPMQLFFLCALTGGVGGCVYCLRGVYIHRCVERNWNSDWYVWYFIRPIVKV